MKFKVTDPAEETIRRRQGISKYFEIVTTLLKTYQDHGAAKVVEVDLERDKNELLYKTTGGIRRVLWNRTVREPTGPLALRCHKLSKYKCHLWLEPDTSEKAVRAIELLKKKRLRALNEKAS
jgi:hypothetical protein